MISAERSLGPDRRADSRVGKLSEPQILADINAARVPAARLKLPGAAVLGLSHMEEFVSYARRRFSAALKEAVEWR
jgi:hypothetical protein